MSLRSQVFILFYPFVVGTPTYCRQKWYKPPFLLGPCNTSRTRYQTPQYHPVVGFQSFLGNRRRKGPRPDYCTSSLRGKSSRVYQRKVTMGVSSPFLCPLRPGPSTPHCPSTPSSPSTPPGPSTPPSSSTPPSVHFTYSVHATQSVHFTHSVHST